VAEYGHSRIEEIKDSDEALPTDDGEDHEEWEDCEDGEAPEETNYYGQL
jgi:hypothetical protein